MGAVADAGATKGVLGDAGTAGDSERGGMADGRARVPEVLAPGGVIAPLYRFRCTPFRKDFFTTRSKVPILVWLLSQRPEPVDC